MKGCSEVVAVLLNCRGELLGDMMSGVKAEKYYMICLHFTLSAEPRKLKSNKYTHHCSDTIPYEAYIDYVTVRNDHWAESLHVFNCSL